MWSITIKLGPIGSAVLTFIGYKQTNRQTDRQTDKPILYIDIYMVKSYVFRFSVSLFDCFQKTAEPIGPNFIVATHRCHVPREGLWKHFLNNFCPGKMSILRIKKTIIWIIRESFVYWSTIKKNGGLKYNI